MTRRESITAKARQTIRQRLLARLPANPGSLPQAYRRFLKPLKDEGLITWDNSAAVWRRATLDHPLTAPHARGEARVSRATSPSIVDYHADGTIVIIQDNEDTLIFSLDSQQWVVRTLTSHIRVGNRKHTWAHVDSPQGIILTRPPVATRVSVNEVAREDRTLDVTITIRVTTRHPDLAQVASLVLDSLCAGGRPMEFIDGDINALGTGFKICDWSEVLP